MSTWGADLFAIGSAMWNRVLSQARLLQRTTPGPALIRFTAGAAALGAFALALPGSAPSEVLSLLASVAVGVALFPRARWVTMTLLLAVAVWLFTTIVQQHDAPLWRVGLFAAALYVTHASAALAAVVPYDCVVAPGVLLRWAGRLGGVLATSLAGGLMALLIAGQLTQVRTVIGPILGSFVAAGLAGLLAWHLRRR